MEPRETLRLLLEEWLPAGDWDRIRQACTEDVTYVDANNLATYGKEAVIQLLGKGNMLARMIWKDQVIPPNQVVNCIEEHDQVFMEWEALGTFKNGVTVTVPGCTVARFREGQIAFYRDYVNFALFVQWAQQYPDVFQDLGRVESP